MAESEVEAHLLQPLVVGRAVRLHPVAIVVALTVGAIAAGLWGALLAVPVVAAGNAAMPYLTGVEDGHGNRRRGGDRTEPMRPPAYAPLPFLGIEPAVAAVRYESESDGALEGREPVSEPRTDTQQAGAGDAGAAREDAAV